MPLAEQIGQETTRDLEAHRKLFASTSISLSKPYCPSPEEQYVIINARKIQFNTRIIRKYEDATFSASRNMQEMVQAYGDVISAASRSVADIFQAYEDAFSATSGSVDEFIKGLEELVLHRSVKPKTVVDIINKKFKLLSSQDIFNERKIDKTMTYEKFLERRKNSCVPIEDFIIKERYE